MVEVLARNWGLVVFRGITALLFGVLTLFVPTIGLATLILLFGAFALVDGVMTVVSAIRDRRNQPYWPAHLIAGIAGVAIGVITFVMPGVTALALLYLIAGWAVVTGIAEIVTAIRLRKVITGEWLLVIAGVLSVGVGVLLALFPGAGALAVTLWIGAYAVVLGVILVALGLRLRGWLRRSQPAAAA